MKVLYAASEAVPFIASGGLAEVAGSLPRALCGHNSECRVVIPLYSEIPQTLKNSMRYITSFEVPLSWRRQYCGIFEADMNGLRYYIIDNEYYFKRPGLYGHYDDAERFAFFSRAVLEMLAHIDYKPDILHANDWHTALIPVFYRVFYASSELYSGIKTVFTIHNVQYQGRYDKEILGDVLGMPKEDESILDLDGCVNFMKAAITASDAVTTVSPSYADELQFPFYSYGLDPVVRQYKGKLSGILNGIDYDSYDPTRDKSLIKNYSAQDISGKAENHDALQDKMGLEKDKGAMIIAMVTRLVENKGIGLVQYILDELMTDHVQFALLGKGDYAYENYFRQMQLRYPGRIACRIGFDNDLSRKIYAGADVLLMPSKTEPCGLSQMVALRYGTIPVVRATGGLKDSITDCGNEGGNGYTFQSINAHDMLGAVRRAEGAFALKDLWNKQVRHAMQCDFSWKVSATAYRKLYEQLM